MGIIKVIFHLKDNVDDLYYCIYAEIDAKTREVIAFNYYKNLSREAIENSGTVADAEYIIDKFVENINKDRDYKFLKNDELIKQRDRNNFAIYCLYKADVNNSDIILIS